MILNAITVVELIGGGGNNTLDASGYSFDAILNGGAGNDILIGGMGTNHFTGGAGNDTFTGNEDLLSDLLVETANVNFALSSDKLTGLGNDEFTSIDEVKLTGGAGNNSFKVTDFVGHGRFDGAGGTDSVIGSSKLLILSIDKSYHSAANSHCKTLKMRS